MTASARLIPIQSTTPVSTCGGCGDGVPAPSCHAAPAERCSQPELRGDDELLQRARDSLNSVVEATAGRNLFELHLVKSLRVESGEAELILTFAPRCGSARDLAEDAFDCLRRALPETDIFVRHAA